MDVRIGVTQTAKEIDVELADDTDREKLVKEIEASIGDEKRVLWLTDKRGRTVGIPAAKVAYVEIGSPTDDRRVGFGAHG